jgi:hypothetical protein
VVLADLEAADNFGVAFFPAIPLFASVGGAGRKAPQLISHFEICENHRLGPQVQRAMRDLRKTARALKEKKDETEYERRN